MELSEAETSVLSKGLFFVPVNKNTDEFQGRLPVNFYRRLWLKAHFFDADSEGFSANDDDPFVKHNAKVSS